MQIQLRRHLAAAALYGAMAVSASATPLTLQALIPIPATQANVQPGGAFTSFDISWFDPATGNDYIADRSNGSVDIISGTSWSVIGQAQGFTGQKATTSVSGADGVVTVTSGGVTTLYAGDGNSTLKVFDVTNPASPVLLQSIATSGTHRVDEMAYSPTTHQILAANNADSPAFATIFSTTGGTAPVSIAVTGINTLGIGGAAGDGMEQPVWNPNTGTFFVSIPAFNGDQGGVLEIRTDGTLGHVYKFASMTGGPASCGPAGLTVGASGNLLVGCSVKGSQTVILNPTANGGAGAIVTTIAAVSGSDEVWYDSASNDFYVTGVDTSGNRIFSVISDATDTVVQNVLLPALPGANPHSITVDSLNGDVFVPIAGSVSGVPDSTCPLGCVAVFGVPEPGSLPMLSFGAAVLLGLGLQRRFPRG